MNRPFSTAFDAGLPRDRDDHVTADFQSRYMPLANDEAVSVSSTVPVAASLIWILFDSAPRAVHVQRVQPRSWAWPSVRFTLTVKLVAEYQAASIRPVPPGFWRAWGAVVLVVQVSTTGRWA